MNTPVADQVASLIAGIEPAGLAALRVGFTFAVIVFLLAGVLFSAGDTSFSMVIQMSRTTFRSFATIASRKSFLSGAV